jgi:hypothetical protein
MLFSNFVYHCLLLITNYTCSVKLHLNTVPLREAYAIVFKCKGLSSILVPLI